MEAALFMIFSMYFKDLCHHNR